MDSDFDESDNEMPDEYEGMEMDELAANFGHLQLTEPTASSPPGSPKSEHTVTLSQSQQIPKLYDIIIQYTELTEAPYIPQPHNKKMCDELECLLDQIDIFIEDYSLSNETPFITALNNAGVVPNEELMEFLDQTAQNLYAKVRHYKDSEQSRELPGYQILETSEPSPASELLPDYESDTELQELPDYEPESDSELPGYESDSDMEQTNVPTLKEIATHYSQTKTMLPMPTPNTETTVQALENLLQDIDDLFDDVSDDDEVTAQRLGQKGIQFDPQLIKYLDTLSVNIESNLEYWKNREPIEEEEESSPEKSKRLRGSDLQTLRKKYGESSQSSSSTASTSSKPLSRKRRISDE